jgi:hypothetical protein
MLTHGWHLGTGPIGIGRMIARQVRILRCRSVKQKGNAMSKNLQGKTVDRDHAYEVWQSFDGSWTWYVLKKYQSPEKEAANEYARWFTLVVTPMVPHGELGDTYVRDIKANARKIN